MRPEKTDWGTYFQIGLFLGCLLTLFNWYVAIDGISYDNVWLHTRSVIMAVAFIKGIHYNYRCYCWNGGQCELPVSENPWRQVVCGKYNARERRKTFQ